LAPAISVPAIALPSLSQAQKCRERFRSPPMLEAVPVKTSPTARNTTRGTRRLTAVAPIEGEDVECLR
jgi:hypothetical protein